MDLSDKVNEIIFFMDKSREVSEIPNGVQAQFEIPSQKRTARLTLSRTVIGRKGADIKIDDMKVSEEHAAIGYFDGIFFILDLKSKNGTYVNGKRVREHVLRDGDEVKVGDTKMTFSASGKLLEEATERWSERNVSISRILSTMIDSKSGGKFDDPTRIVIEGGQSHTAKAPMHQLFFEVIDGLEKGQRFNFLQKEILIGRGKGDLVLKDPDVSKRHAEVVTYGPDQIFIRDLGSTNGTFIGDEKVDRKQLKHGDIVTLGSTKLEVSFGEVVSVPYKAEPSFDEKTTEKKNERACLKLLVTEGRDKGENFLFAEGEYIIGRDIKDTGECLSLRDMDVSRSHAKIMVAKNHKAYLSDLASTNGTILNGKKIKKAELKQGDEITVGKTRIIVVALPK
jgi:pSer/pThr/pTyr-binding forkhead associated (FHA) protein